MRRCGPAPSTVHLTNAYHATSGGIRTFYRALLEAAEAEGRRMDLVVPSAGRTVEVERLGRSTAIHHVPAPSAPGFDRRYRLLHPGHYLGPGGRVARLLARMQPDVVEICDKYALVHLGRSLRHGRSGWRPTVVAASFERMDDNVAAYLSRRAWLRRVSHAYLRWIYAPAVDAHIANSEYTADELRQGGCVAHVEVCGMGVDADRFSNARRDPSLRRRLLTAAGGADESVLALYAGRLSPEKHLHLLIEALASAGARTGAPDVRLAMAGDGPARPALQALAARLVPGRVAFLETIADRGALATLYAAADVFVHPNPKEPFGIGPLEAMAAGVPVVLANAGGVLSYAHAANAWLAAPRADCLAAAMLDAIGGRGDPRLQRARETAWSFAWPLMARRYLEALDRLHARRSASGVASGLAKPAAARS